MGKYVLSVLLIISLNAILKSQSELALGQWKSHLAYKEGKWVTQSKDNVFLVSQRGMMSINKEDLSVRFFSKEDGLSDVNISRLHYDEANEQLIIIYSDSNIDIIQEDDIVNLPFVKTNSNILGSRQINDVFIADDTYAYMATDFGVLGFNLQKLEFSFTTFTDIKILSVAAFDGFLYAGTEDGLFKIALQGTNLSDFNIWTPIDQTQGLPSSFDVIDMTPMYGSLFAVINNEVYQQGSDGNFSIIYSPTKEEGDITFISSEGSSLMIGVEGAGPKSKLVLVAPDGTQQAIGIGCINRVANALEDKQGRIWFGDQWDPVKYLESINGECKRLSFEVPFANTAGEVTFKNNVAFISSGGVTEDYQPSNSIAGFYIYDDQSWKNYNLDNVPLMRSQQVFNVHGIAPDPNPASDDVYIGSYWNGIMRYNTSTGDSELWNKDNSVLQAIVGDANRTRISSLVFDKDDNLWISNYGAPEPLVVKTSDDKWYRFAVPGNTTLGDIAIDDQGNKWIAVVGAGNGLLVYNEGNNIGDPGDDSARYISRNNSEIAGNKVNCVVVDLDGSVWIGTSQGPVVFDCGDPFDNSCRGNTRKVVVDDIPALLLKDEDILSIEVDGANRKWFGTRNGIFVQSPDGITEIMKFDTKNSPLLDNKVTDLSYNPQNGEMFVTSSGGMQSYKTETLVGSRTHSATVYAYPNPVRPDYTGPIAIKGLVRDANVKITDISGKLIYETKALGGQAIWDGNDYNGVRASTGVYLVFSANENTSLSTNAYVTKILVVH